MPTKAVRMHKLQIKTIHSASSRRVMLAVFFASSSSLSATSPGHSGQGFAVPGQHHRGGGGDSPLRHRGLTKSEGDLNSAMKLSEKVGKNEMVDDITDQVTEEAKRACDREGRPGGPPGLELNSAVYKADDPAVADPNSSQPNNMAVAFELNL